MSTEEAVAPLDAYITARPDEPTFTLQGGDPLAPHLVRLWAAAARGRTGLRINLGKLINDFSIIVVEHTLEYDKREVANLRLRATAAEEVSWAMDEYTRGGSSTPVDAADTHIDEPKRIELHDLKVRCAQKLSNFRCEMIEMQAALDKAGYDSPATAVAMGDVVQRLLQLNEAIEPRRIMKKD